MTTKTTSSKTWQRHSQQYKTESLALAEKVGAPTAAKQSVTTGKAGGLNL